MACTGPIIGLTGAIGSGKSTVCGILQRCGARIIDADQLAHQTYLPGKPCHQPIIATFGAGILAPDGTIDRQKLALLVFQNQSRMKQLTGLVWPETVKSIQQSIGGIRSQDIRAAIVIEAALLFQAGWAHIADKIWLVSAPRHLRLRRIIKRNRLLTEAEVIARIRSQENNEAELHGKGDLTFQNQGSMQQLHNRVMLEFKKLGRLPRGGQEDSLHMPPGLGLIRI